MADRVIIQERYVRPCPDFPQGRWLRKIADGEWTVIEEQLPIHVIVNPKFDWAEMTQEMTHEEAEKRGLMKAGLNG